MGLIAREVERRGIPTLCMTSALSITRAVNPPRAVYLDYPLGHTAGKPDAPELQREILQRTLQGFNDLQTPGSVLMLPFRWTSDDLWKDAVMRPGSDRGANFVDGSGDNRLERLENPQYQCEQDRLKAEMALRQGGCPTCVFLEGDA